MTTPPAAHARGSVMAVVLAAGGPRIQQPWRRSSEEDASAQRSRTTKVASHERIRDGGGGGGGGIHGSGSKEALVYGAGGARARGSAAALSDGVCGARVQQLHLLQHPVKNAVAERKHTRISSDISDPSTPRKIEVEDAKNISIYNDVIDLLFELETITKSFRADYLLGEGGFVTVYKGYIDENVRVGLKSLPVAVKVLNKDGHQGHKRMALEKPKITPFNHK
uniref:Protein kinase domain-containing protein n=1 Tax=Oryza nivara TaxID=4536 RepID=A0A0E0IXI9_ORYNI